MTEHKYKREYLGNRHPRAKYKHCAFIENSKMCNRAFTILPWTEGYELDFCRKHCEVLRNLEAEEMIIDKKIEEITGEEFVWK